MMKLIFQHFLWNLLQNLQTASFLIKYGHVFFDILLEHIWPMLAVYDLWARRDFYRATAAVIRGLGFNDRIDLESAVLIGYRLWRSIL